MNSEKIVSRLDRVAGAQFSLFREYQKAGAWKEAQASPTSAISQMDDLIVIFHQVYTVLLHQDLSNPIARKFVRWYLFLQYRLIVRARVEKLLFRFHHREVSS